MELNYHACCTVSHSVVAEHVGVRFHDPETADAITLLISVCLDSDLNLAKVDMDIEATLQYLQHFFAMPTITTIPLFTEQTEFSPSRF